MRKKVYSKAWTNRVWRPEGPVWQARTAGGRSVGDEVRKEADPGLHGVFTPERAYFIIERVDCGPTRSEPQVKIILVLLFKVRVGGRARLCTYAACLHVPTEARREHRISQNRSYRQL